MKTLAEAWSWYGATRRSLAQLRRLGERHWSNPSLAGATIWQDDQFKMLEAGDIVAQTTIGLKPVDDLAVVVLFSVFESVVRDYLIALIKPQAETITDPILKAAIEDAILGVAEGSFYRRVLEPLKKQNRVSAELVTEVDQVRDYRNWVAHGRREDPTNNVTPEVAFRRLSNFLEALGITVEPERDSPAMRAELR